MNKPSRMIGNKEYLWVAEYKGRPEAERRAFFLRMKGAYVRVVRNAGGTYDLYGRRGRPLNKPRP